MSDKSLRIALVALVVLALTVGPLAATGASAMTDVVAAADGEITWFNGPITHWPDAWTPIPDLNDPRDAAAPAIDFVGSPASPGAYFAADENYVYFRTRVDVDEVAVPAFPLTSQDINPPAGWNDRTFRDQILIAIDNTADGIPDWGIAWDTRDWPYYHRGLELLYRDGDNLALAAAAPGWSQLREADGEGGVKVSPPDFGWNSTDGYVRTVDQQETADFEATSFVDFAVSWEFLARQRSFGLPLFPGQTWRVQLVSVSGQADAGLPGLAGDMTANGGVALDVTPPPVPALSTTVPTPEATVAARSATPASTAPTTTLTRSAAPTSTPTAQPGGWQRARFADFLEFRYPSGWMVTGRGDTSVLRGSYKGHDYVIDIFRPERPTGTSLEGWVEAELKRFQADPDAVTVRSLVFARVKAMRVNLLDLPGGDCPASRIYAWSEDPPIPGIRQAMITVSQADKKQCDPNALETFVDMLSVMANK